MGIFKKIALANRDYSHLNIKTDASARRRSSLAVLYETLSAQSPQSTKDTVNLAPLGAPLFNLKKAGLPESIDLQILNLADRSTFTQFIQLLAYPNLKMLTLPSGPIQQQIEIKKEDLKALIRLGKTNPFTEVEDEITRYLNLIIADPNVTFEEQQCPDSFAKTRYLCQLLSVWEQPITYVIPPSPAIVVQTSDSGGTQSVDRMDHLTLDPLYERVAIEREKIRQERRSARRKGVGVPPRSSSASPTTRRSQVLRITLPNDVHVINRCQPPHVEISFLAGDINRSLNEVLQALTPDTVQKLSILNAGATDFRQLVKFNRLTELVLPPVVSGSDFLEASLAALETLDKCGSATLKKAIEDFFMELIQAKCTCDSKPITEHLHVEPLPQNLGSRHPQFGTTPMQMPRHLVKKIPPSPPEGSVGPVRWTHSAKAWIGTDSQGKSFVIPHPRARSASPTPRAAVNGAQHLLGRNSPFSGKT